MPSDIPKLAERYVHYKNPNLPYTVVSLAMLEATEELCVVYRAEYGEKLTWVRPLDNFLDTVTVDGKEVPRFSPIA